MAKSKSRKKKPPKRVLALPDLEHAKTVVLNSLMSVSGQRTYGHAIREFVSWSCSEPRLAFNRTVVLRYRIHLEQRGYAPATINLRLAAVRRVVYEAADAGLLSPELAAGIRRVKGVRRIEKLAPHDRRRTCARLCLGGWGAGPDPVPARACLHPNDGTLPRMQATPAVRGERPPRNRAGRGVRSNGPGRIR
jgi:hypothetical protein